MNTTPTVRALLALENSAPEVLFSRVPGSEAFLWPLARWPIAKALASANLNVSSPPQSSQRLGMPGYLKLVAREFLPAPRSIDRVQEPVEYLFIVGGTTRAPAPNGVGNWLSDAFSMSLGRKALVAQETPIDLLTPASGRPANPRTWSLERVSTRVGRSAKANPPSTVEKETVVKQLKQIYSYFNELLPAHLHDALTKEVLWRVARVRYEDSEFLRLLDRLRPRHIFMEEAAYGHYSNSIRRAHERGVKVAELQHGWIGPSHAAYNYGNCWLDSPLTSSLPDSILTFGEYWGEELRFPGELIPVGKPQLEQASLTAAPYQERKQRLLIVSSIYETEKLVAATLLLRRMLPATWEIALRPHPAERSNAESIFAHALVPGVSLDEAGDVNESIASSRAVVGMVSTVLFEALPMGVHIGVIETKLGEFYASARIFSQRLDEEASFEEFTRVISLGNAPDMKSVETIWHPRPVESFIELCESK